MSKWLERLREHEKKRQIARDGADKIDRMPSEAISSILSVRSGRESANFRERPDEEAEAAIEERAAILEYDCGLRRDEAERLACIQISTTIH